VATDGSNSPPLRALWCPAGGGGAAAADARRGHGRGPRRGPCPSPHTRPPAFASL